MKKETKKPVKKSVKRTGRALVNPPMEKLVRIHGTGAIVTQKDLNEFLECRDSNVSKPKTLKSISVKSAGFVKLLKNQDKGIRWQCKGLNGEILSGCENMKRKADVLQNMILTHKLLGVMIKELKG